MKLKKKIKSKKKLVDFSLSVEEIKQIKGGQGSYPHDIITPSNLDTYDVPDPIG